MTDSKKELIQKAFKAMQTSIDAEYFFEHLNSPDWIEPMIELGIFSSPPEMLLRGNEVTLPIWPQSRYLIRMAPLDPKAVLHALRSIPETNNARIRDDMLRAILELPLEDEMEFIPRILLWLESPYRLSLPEETARLICKLAVGGRPSEAIEMARSLLGITVDPEDLEDSTNAPRFLRRQVRAKFEVYEYERLLEMVLPDLIVNTKEACLALMLDFVAILHGLTSESSSESAWLLKHPSIEQSEQTRDHDIEDFVINSCRDVAMQLVNLKLVSVDDLLGMFETRSGILFDRLAIHCVRTLSPRDSSYVAQFVTCTQYLFSIGCLHEYWHLIHDRFRELSVLDQDKFFDAVSTGPKVEDSTSPSNLPVSEDQERLALWQFRILSAISDELRPPWTSVYQELQTRFGELEHPDFLSYLGKMWTGPTSPISSSEILGMSSEEFFDFIHDWKPSGEWQSETRSGLGRELAAAVSQEPMRFANVAPKFIGENPIYISSIFTGLRRAVIDKRSFLWQPVLELADWASQQVDSDNLEPELSDAMDDNWSWTRRTIVDLFENGLDQGESEIDFDLRDAVWRVLERLTADADPSPEDEAARGGANMDPLSLSINTVRGVAITSTIKYGLWAYRNLKSEQFPGQELKVNFSQMPEVRAVLDGHLNTHTDPSLAIRSVYGRYLPWLHLLDSDWLVQNLKFIFPSELSSSRYWDAAWEAYISSCRVFDNVFYVLEPEYRRAVYTLDRDADVDQHPHGVESRLAEHLMILFWRGIIDIDEGYLLDAFYEIADDELSAWAMSFLGRSFIAEEQTEDSPTSAKLTTELSSRLQRLWEMRLQAAVQNRTSGVSRKEIASFGWWYSAGEFDSEWRLEQLMAALRISKKVDRSRAVLRRLETDSIDNPRLAVKALRLMIQGDAQGWSVLVWDEEISNILSSVLGAEDRMAKLEALDVIEVLGARGYGQYRRFLPRG